MSAVTDACDVLGIAAPPPFVAIGGAAIAAPLPPVPYIVPALGFARSAAPNMIGGYGYSRKTLALQDMALSIATGTPVWERFECVQAPVVHIDYEQGDYLSRLRYQRMAHARGIDLARIGDRLRFATAPRAYLDSEGVEDHLVQFIGDAGFAFVDSLKAATPSLEENSSAIRIPLDMLLRVSMRTGACIVVVHHARKPSREDTGGSKTILRGSSAIFDACSSVLTFASDAGEPTTVVHPKNRWTGQSVDPFSLDSEDTDGGRGLRVFARDATDTAEPPWMAAIQSQIVAAVTKRSGLTKTVLLKGLPGKADRKKEAFDALEADGVIRNAPRLGVQLALL